MGLICGENLANNKKSNVERHFQTKHTAFAEKYPSGEKKKKNSFGTAVESLSEQKYFEEVGEIYKLKYFC